MSDFTANSGVVIKINPIRYIRKQLESGENADHILKELLDNISNDKFKESLCDGLNCKKFYTDKAPFAEDRSKMTELYRLDHKITLICKEEECDLDEVRKFYNTLSAQKPGYQKKIDNGDSLDELIKQLNSVNVAGGGKQKKQTGGGIPEIAQLLAGLDVVVLAMLNKSGMDVEIINRTIDGTISLLSKAAVAISALPRLPACMREIMGDTLYRIVERFTTSMIAYKAAAFTWEHKMALISVLGKILSYAPDAAGLAISLIAGFVVTKVATSAASAAASVDYKGQAIAALDALDAATPGDLANVGTKVVTKTVDLTKTFISLSVDLVIKIRKDLAAAGDALAAQNVIANAASESKIRGDWTALLYQTGLKDLPGQTALNDDEKRKLNIMFENQFAAIRDAIRTSPEYIAAQPKRARSAGTDAAAMSPGAGASMGAAMSPGPDADEEQVAKKSRGAKMAEEVVSDSIIAAENAEDYVNESRGAENTEEATAINHLSEGQKYAKQIGETFGFGGKRKSQKQKKQKQQKKTQKQSQKKLSKSKREKKAKQSKKANKKH